MKEVVLITGAGGMIAKELAKKIGQDYEIRFLTRHRKQENEYEWDIKKGTVDETAFDNVSHIIHLAGANISEKRWTPERKRELISSRVDSAELLRTTLRKNKIKLKSFISASGINFYGTKTSEKIDVETDPPGNDFLSEVVVLWERAADDFKEQELAERVVKIRTAVVLSEKDGALKKMVPPVQYYIGSPLGSGKQYMPWIHIEDICSIYEFALKNSTIEGAYNAVSPQHATNKELTKKIAKVLGKPLWMPNVPGFVLKLIFGELASVILEGSRASSEKILNAGFHFKFPDLEKALRDLLKKQ
ncbi:Epimerase family protein SA0724 [Chryseobacterium gleum]|uniref:Epimerase family protein SA0724 n=2 Tax=Chryseobacterium gleum TaxID=250 RepID=A0A448AYT8_CHRGE|nr:TIGR01777 family oxidoreductase [Chryseobacterium gleum]EFK34390.1 TIGR01777 family protein [Chryseobacterium gleum ATCC 35910]QQY30246.1 TIGR01777 family oxidoreductase [Chryseobacterium gleum]VEE05436.1 Epimerase family protein SA0724 [Chryseobacterium gleum]